MTIRLHWWYLPIALAIIPLIYRWLRTEGGPWDFEIDTMLVAAACWMGAIGIVIGHLL